MKTRPPSQGRAAEPDGFPDAASLAALRAWYEGLPAREAVSHYLGHRKADGQSSRGILGRVQRQLAAFARRRHRQDLAELFLQPAAARHQHARAVARALELLPTLPEPQPLIGDDIDQWLPPRTVRALRAEGIKTLAALTLRIPRRRRWWSVIPGLGAAGATQVEAFFAAHPELTERARAPLVLDEPRDVVPWERLIVPADVDEGVRR